MSDEATGAMAGEPTRAPPSSAEPGLVLAYAPPGSDAASVVPRVIVLEPGSTIIGREPPPGGVKLALTSVSRLHARIQRKGDACTIHDLGSRNGVLVRGALVEASGSALLDDGDDVRIGDVVFVFVQGRARDHLDASGTSASPYPHAPIAGGPATRLIFEALTPIARSTLPVLVLGETGTGKELVAEAIHAASGRPGALRALNCAAIPATLVESELFGFKKGAFSGADRDRNGIVKAAEGGTLFLDEIGDLPTEIQPKLLRLLESNEIAPIGAARTEKVDVRIVCATHTDLAALVEQKRFRADLYSRIRGYVLTLPPLRARKQDIGLLVSAILERLERPGTKTSVAFMVALIRHDWPFNIRELVTVLRRAVALALPGETLDTKHLPEELLQPRLGAVAAASSSSSSRESVAPPLPAQEDATARPPIPSAEEMREALRANGGNVAALARIFQRDRSLIHRWLKQHGIEPEDFRPR